jgi:hypothetical protein
MSQHTPGPWYVTDGGIRPTVNGQDGTSIACLSDTGDEAEANARLIAVGPELLGAAEALLSDWDSPTLSDSTPIAEKFDALRSAVAKARDERGQS